MCAAILRMIKSIIPYGAERLKTVNKDDVQQYIDAKYLPVRMGGTVRTTCSLTTKRGTQRFTTLRETKEWRASQSDRAFAHKIPELLNEIPFFNARPPL